ncbi:unnamed protein product [Cyclocybe aegerita]|uniref:F-box domain-containing protein n=1 Tax=Cyclocybe aegerita TaxID=1973307 RepID=A0A8S0VS96_CYCAE|nr:unnamed protein product [Cyclocybe aegerita]
MPENVVLRQEVEREIAATKSHIEDLQKKLYVLAGKLNMTSSIMSTLPPDVLAEIFFLAVQEGSFNSVPVPYVLGGTCRAWRNIVWSTPLLWSFLIVKLTQKNEQAQRTLLEDWIKRSANYPLHVHLTAPGYESSDSYSILLRSCAQWRSLMVNSYNSHGLRYKMLDGHPFPLLSHISLYINPLERFPWNFNSAPQLRALELSGRGRPSQIICDWAVVQDLKATFDVNDWLSILRSMSSLRTCKLILAKHPIDPAIHFNDRGGPHNIPALTKLSLQYIGAETNDEIIFLLRNVSVPALERLEITTDIPDWFTDLKEVLLRSQCSLTELTIRIIASPDSTFEDDLVELLSSVPSVIHLNLISKSALSDRLINALNPDLSPNTEAQGCLPNLTTFSCNGEILFGLDSILSMLRAREKTITQESVGAQSGALKELESFTIRYRNAAWAQTKNPNALRMFYFEMAAFGTKTNVMWDEAA